MRDGSRRVTNTKPKWLRIVDRGRIEKVVHAYIGETARFAMECSAHNNVWHSPRTPIPFS